MRTSHSKQSLSVILGTTKDDTRPGLKNIYVHDDGSLMASNGHLLFSVGRVTNESESMPDLLNVIPEGLPKFKISIMSGRLRDLIEFLVSVHDEKNDHEIPIDFEFFGKKEPFRFSTRSNNHGQEIKGLIMPCLSKDLRPGGK